MYASSPPPSDPKSRSSRSRNPFESPSCPEGYQQASSSAQSAELFHYISMSPEDYNLQLRDGCTPNRLPSRPRSRLQSTRTSASSELENPESISDELFFETPCKQISRLKIDDNHNQKKNTPKKQPKNKSKNAKLLGSKSLSQLMSKLHRRSSSKKDDEKRTEPPSVEQQVKPKSISYVLPRQSTSKSLAQQLNSIENHLTPVTQDGPSISPILQTHGKLIREIVASTPSLPLNRNRESTIDCRLRLPKDDQHQSTSKSTDQGIVQKDKKQADGVAKQEKTTKYRPFKSTALVLRDVKNSISLRLKAKRQNQDFEQLTNESMTLATPDVKLYSPFSICTPSVKSENMTSKNARKKEAKLSKKRLNLAEDENHHHEDPSTKQEKESSSKISGNKSLKTRIALRHKKHLLENNKFAFDSPTGRLRETVRDVEQLQQKIEDISHAIKARGEVLIED